MDNARVYRYAFSSIYPLYVQKVEKKGRTRDELDTVIGWLTGFDRAEMQRHIDDGSTLEEFFAAADLNPASEQITGVICGVRIEQIEEPLMKKIRYLDKVVDELAKGRALERIMRA
ncbi:DUF2200 domain-containing protein [Microbacterium sp. No. 7]|uniref:DUF2200 domain-containing protein n=1 Tax=Microbacterium sp. No. 7 TaxID=1714373 RepID=UPI0006D147EC|nr:DUF2200 domain-containing protein [Microbacterium sp. No. 7]ALJ20843.1 hypothetical protein AOA12_13390 [Microbacterium sp. No. 7]